MNEVCDYYDIGEIKDGFPLSHCSGCPNNVYEEGFSYCKALAIYQGIELDER